MKVNGKPEIIVNGLRYYIGATSIHAPAHWKGFGGRRWTIKFNTGDLIQTDDLMWDYSFKNHSRPDTAVILEGWDSRSARGKTCYWQRAGEYQVFGPVRFRSEKRG